MPISPISVAYGFVVKKINRLFNNRFPKNKFTIGVQDPITLTNNSEPEPDIYLAEGPLEKYRTHHPYADNLLVVIEVADSTLDRDGGPKRFTYASAGITEYWIVNVFAREIERYTNPIPHEGRFAMMEVFKLIDKIASPQLGTFSLKELVFH